jgi:hypothetical protein
MSESTMEQRFNALLQAFGRRLDEIDRLAESSDELPYRADGAHVMVGAREPLSDDYFRAHGLQPVGAEASHR